MGKTEFLSTLKDVTYQKNLCTLFRKIAPYEERFEKPVHQFTARQFIEMFAGEGWTKTTTFRNNKYLLGQYFDWLEGQHIKTSKYRLNSLGEDDIPSTSRFASYFYSYEDMDEAYQVVFPDAISTHMYIREMLCSVLCAIGLTVEQIFSLKEHDIDPDGMEIHSGDIVFRDIPFPFMERIVKAMQAKTYLLRDIERKFEISDYVVKRASIVGERDRNYIKNIVYKSVSISAKSKTHTKWEQKSFLPKDLCLSYWYCHLFDQEEKEGVHINELPSKDRSDWIEHNLRRWNGVGFKYHRTKDFFIDDYLHWRAYRTGEKDGISG